MPRSRRLASTLLALLLCLPASALLPSASAYPGPTTSTTSALLSLPGVNATLLSLSGADNGSALAAWVEVNGGNVSVVAADHSAAGVWSSPTVLGTTNAGVFQLQTARDSDGNVAVSWGVGAFPTSIWFAQRLSGGPWSAATLVANGTAATLMLGILQFKSGPSGLLFFAWIDTNGSGPLIHAATADPVSGVDGPTTLSNGTYYASGLSLAPGPAGDALAMWFEWNDTPLYPESDLMLSHFVQGSGWSVPELGTVAYRSLLVSGAPSTPPLADASTDAANTTTVVWFGQNATAYGVAIAQRSPSGNWTAPAVLAENAAGSTETLVLTPAPDGSFVVGWTLLYVDIFGTGGSTGYAHAAVYTPASGWRSMGKLVDNVPGLVYLATSARSSTSAVAAVGYYLTATAGPDLAEFTGLEGCSGWSSLHAGAGPSGDLYAVALSWPSTGPGTLLYITLNGTSYEVRATSFDLPAPPPFTVDSPSNGAVLDRAVAYINGSSEPNDHIDVGGYTGTADASGHFSVRVPLIEGDNAFTVRATRVGAWAPCTPSVSFHITYENPVPALQADLASTSAELARVKVQFPWLQDNISADEARIAALQGSLNSANTAASSANTRAEVAGQGTGLGVMLGGLGLVVGAAGLCVAVMAMRRRPRSDAPRKEEKSP
jgi:hypothetical protein